MHPSPADVTVVIPAYNSRTTLLEAIASVRAQTCPPREIIVVDDGSRDGTAEAVAALDGPVHLVRQANGGPARARNAGLALARGEWLAMLDADDVWLPEKLERQLARGSADCILTGLWWPGPRGEIGHAYRGPLERDALCAAMLQSNVLAGGCSTALIRRTTLERVGGFDPTYVASEDRDFFFRLARVATVDYVREPLVRRRRGPVQYGGDPQRNLVSGQRIIAEFAPRIGATPAAVRRARANLLRRTGMHYLYQGDRRPAFGYLLRSVRLWPFMADPWRAALNALLGRLPKPASAVVQ